jgi:hypothetical protein
MVEERAAIPCVLREVVVARGTWPVSREVDEFNWRELAVGK